MKLFNKFIIPALLLVVIDLSAQKQQINWNNFQNPFSQKNATNNTNVISPTNLQKHEKKILKEENGSFYADLSGFKLDRSNFEIELLQLFELSQAYTLQKINEQTDKHGSTHHNFQLLYKGYPVEHNTILLHEKDGNYYYVNGRIEREINEDPTIIVSKEEALRIAKSYLMVDKVIQSYPIETVWIKSTTAENNSIHLTRRVRIDSYSPFEMCYLYIDAKDGSIINKVPLIADVDVNGSGQTLYSGLQNMTVDSFASGYRLRDNARNIETYDATNAGSLTLNGFTNSIDYISSTRNFGNVPVLDSVYIGSLSSYWWYHSIFDVNPDIYIVIKDGNGTPVYTSNYYNNTQPPLIFDNLNIPLTNPPYTVNLWDYDIGSNDDFGGSILIFTPIPGNMNWTINNSTGALFIKNGGNPANDVHWGMQITYDFYKDSLGRDSYDNLGSIIKNFLNPPTLQSRFGNSSNNAYAKSSPYNIMAYGLGDGVNMNPVVGLDVEGHEFTHLVINNNGNGGLTYQAESGALNESFADIFGTCIEYFSGVNPDWLIGEDVEIARPALRSMSNPKSEGQPDTYQGSIWINTGNTSASNDYGGVHRNSGVQNFWFYLLVNGGTGTNDLNNSYSVSGIGLSKARDIAYRNLTTYLTPNATHQDAYLGSLQAAEDLYGNPSSEYTSVRQAWYAVGIGNSPSGYCSGTVNLTAPTGSFTDGSGSANYENNSSCKWVIAPPGATRIGLSFSQFDTEANYDSIMVFDGPDDTYPLLMSWWGSNTPPTVLTSNGVGAMCLKFISDGSITRQGFSASYSSQRTTPSCGGLSVLSSTSGTFTDGSGGSNYGNNQECAWIIAPPCANSVTLSFTQFDTETGYDGVVIYDDYDLSNLLAVYSGNTLPTAVTSNTGRMVVLFLSDYSFTRPGFSASYISSGSAACNGTVILNTSDHGSISDGSGTANYCNNTDCKWLIQPPQATSVTLDFTSFDLEERSPDGQTIYDAVEIYDGPTTNDSLLGVFTGTNLPPRITSTGGSMLVHFYSDLDSTKTGWTANYNSSQAISCNDTTILVSSSGNISDGSGNSDYSNNSRCNWIIRSPSPAIGYEIRFNNFNTESNADYLLIYDGLDTNNSNLVAQYSGATTPPLTSVYSDSIIIIFYSDDKNRAAGWDLNYQAFTSSVPEYEWKQKINLFPNPTSGRFEIRSDFEENINLEIRDLQGRIIANDLQLRKGRNSILLDQLPSGTYFLKFQLGNDLYFEKLIIN